MKIYAVKDVKIGFADPFLSPNRGVAIRTFSLAMTDENSRYRGYKEDMELYELGDYDEITGHIVAGEPDYVMGGKDV